MSWVPKKGEVVVAKCNYQCMSETQNLFKNNYYIVEDVRQGSKFGGGYGVKIKTKDGLWGVSWFKPSPEYKIKKILEYYAKMESTEGI